MAEEPHDDDVDDIVQTTGEVTTEDYSEGSLRDYSGIEAPNEVRANDGNFAMERFLQTELEGASLLRVRGTQPKGQSSKEE